MSETTGAEEIERFPWTFAGHGLLVNTNDNYTPVPSTVPLSEVTGGQIVWELVVQGEYTSAGIVHKCKDESSFIQSWLGCWVSDTEPWCYFLTTNEDISEQVGNPSFCKYTPPVGEAQVWVLCFTPHERELTVNVFLSEKDFEHGSHEPFHRYTFSDVQMSDDHDWYAVVGCNSRDSMARLQEVRTSSMIKGANKH